jgi:hypothetical protein
LLEELGVCSRPTDFSLWLGGLPGLSGLGFRGEDRVWVWVCGWVVAGGFLKDAVGGGLGEGIVGG